MPPIGCRSLARLYPTQRAADLYRRFGLQMEDGEDAAKKAFFRLSKVAHPDAQSGSKAKFVELKDEYEELLAMIPQVQIYRRSGSKWSHAQKRSQSSASSHNRSDSHSTNWQRYSQSAEWENAHARGARAEAASGFRSSTSSASNTQDFGSLPQWQKNAFYATGASASFMFVFTLLSRRSRRLHKEAEMLDRYRQDPRSAATDSSSGSPNPVDSTLPPRSSPLPRPEFAVDGSFQKKELSSFYKGRLKRGNELKVPSVIRKRDREKKQAREDAESGFL